MGGRNRTNRDMRDPKRWQNCLQGDISENGNIWDCYNKEEEGVIGIYQEVNRNAGCPAAWNNVTWLTVKFHIIHELLLSLYGKSYRWEILFLNI